MSARKKKITKKVAAKVTKHKKNPIKELEDYLEKHKIFIGLMPDSDTLCVSCEKDRTARFGGTYIGIDPIENNVYDKRRSFRFCKKNILEYNSVGSLVSEMFDNEDGFYNNESGLLVNIDDLQFGDVLGISTGGLVYWDDEQERFKTEDECDEDEIEYLQIDTDGCETLRLLYLGESVFVKLENVSEAIFKAAKLMAILHKRDTDLSPLGIDVRHWYSWQRVIENQGNPEECED